jgi:hypothetical protein
VTSKDRRRETAELYAAMYDSGYNPSHGLGPVFAMMLLASIAAVILLMFILTGAGHAVFMWFV